MTLALLAKYRQRGLLLDTNLLVLLVVGSVRPEWIARHPRTNSFTADDYRQVLAIVRSFRRVIVTPHVLAEASNLLNKRIPAADKNLPKMLLDGLREILGGLVEVHVAASEASSDRMYPVLGLTDVALVGVAVSEGVLLLTADLDLYLLANQRGREAINYNHIRAV